VSRDKSGSESIEYFDPGTNSASSSVFEVDFREALRATCAL
jgi:hypothetical protein